ncbi:MAG: hypothetical protein IJJ14_01240 [Coriobacteriales bacterium]|nr:hypothetical protein [Coriobacteriales bacterium]
MKDLPIEEIALPAFKPAPLDPRYRPDLAKYPFFATTGRRIPVYFHNEHRQLPWCREQWPAPRMEINADDAAKLGIEQGDWVWIENHKGKIRQVAEVSYSMRPGIVNLEHQWWFPESDTATKGFELCGANCLCDETVGDPYVGSSSVRAYPVDIYKATPANCPDGKVIPHDTDGVPIICDASDPRLQAWKAGIDQIYNNGRQEVM